jgi:hypothetical protein
LVDMGEARWPVPGTTAFTDGAPGADEDAVRLVDMVKDRGLVPNIASSAERTVV